MIDRAIMELETNELTAGWTAFQKAASTNPIERYACFSGCGKTWQAKRGSKGFNRCRECGLIYAAASLKTVDQVEDAARITAMMDFQKKFKR